MMANQGNIIQRFVTVDTTSTDGIQSKLFHQFNICVIITKMATFKRHGLLVVTLNVCLVDLLLDALRTTIK